MSSRKFIAVLVASILLTSLCFAAEPAEKDAAKAPAKPKVTISKETTYVTQPLRPDGYPDYAAALNERMSEGVTPENNAAVLLQQAFGPKEIPKELRANYFKLLGIPELPEEGDYFVSRDEMIKRWQFKQPQPLTDDEIEKLGEQFNIALTRPWSADEFPIVAEWIAVNKKPLELVRQAAQKKVRFFPVVKHAEDMLLDVRPSYNFPLRESTEALISESMLFAKTGKTSEAWKQLLDCRHVARQKSKAPSIIDLFINYAIESRAMSAGVGLMHFENVPRKNLQEMRDQLTALAPFPTTDLVFEISQRFEYLDAVFWVSQRGLAGIRALSTGKLEPHLYTDDSRIGSDAMIDWNVPLRMGNAWYDRCVQIARIQNVAERATAARILKSDLQQLSADIKNPRRFGWDFISKPSLPEVVSPRIGGIFLILMLSATDGARVAEQRTELLLEMEQVAFALAAYRAANTEYPESLMALVPEFIAKIPIDTFREDAEPIGYRREDAGYVLWTVHVDRVDDDGADSEDGVFDDFALRRVAAVN